MQVTRAVLHMTRCKCCLFINDWRPNLGCINCSHVQSTRVTADRSANEETDLLQLMTIANHVRPVPTSHAHGEAVSWWY